MDSRPKIFPFADLPSLGPWNPLLYYQHTANRWRKKWKAMQEIFTDQSGCANGLLFFFHFKFLAMPN
jgi:hypothetical protein